MEKINAGNVIKSFFLGLFIGLILQGMDHTNALISYKVMTVLASGSIGFIIGLLTEWLTSLLPIGMAKAGTYFFINNCLALVVTTILLSSLLLAAGGEVERKVGFLPVLLMVLGIICIANLTDYVMYRRAQHQLNSFKARMKEK